MVSVTLWVARPTGEYTHILDTIVRLDYRRTVNSTGMRRGFFGAVAYPLRVEVPYRHDLAQTIGRDWRLEIWRDIAGQGASLDTDTVWLIQRVTRRVDSHGQRLLILEAVPSLALLEWRIVAYPHGSSQATRHNVPADDAIKAIVRENVGTLAGADRDISAWLHVEHDTSAGAPISTACARRTLLAVAQELAEASATAGTPLFFDIVATGSRGLEFRTYTGARGADRSLVGSGLVEVSAATGTLANEERVRDWYDEVTHVYVAGQGAAAGRQVIEVGDEVRAAATPFGRRETVRDARHIATEQGLRSEGYARLAAGLPTDEISGQIISRAPHAIYGHHWKFGDVVQAVVWGEVIRCRVDSVAVALTASGETVTVDLVVADPAGSGRGAASAYAATLAAAERTDDTEYTHQQIQTKSVPADGLISIPADGSLIVYGSYTIAGTLHIARGGELRLRA